MRNWKLLNAALSVVFIALVVFGLILTAHYLRACSRDAYGCSASLLKEK